MRNCEIKLPCGHICPKICHLNDRSHVEYRCNVPCARSCDLGHPCPKKCWQDCKPCLSQVVKKLPCDHLQDVECHKDPNEEYCQTKMEKVTLLRFFFFRGNEIFKRIFKTEIIALQSQARNGLWQVTG